MAFQNGQTRQDIERLTTGARATENEFRTGLGSIIEKADASVRSVTVNNVRGLPDANDNWSVTIPIDGEDTRIPPRPPAATPGELELVSVENPDPNGPAFEWQARTPFSIPRIGDGNLFRPGDPVPTAGTATPRRITTSTFRARVPWGDFPLPTSTISGAQRAAFILQAPQQTWPGYTSGWNNNRAIPGVSSGRGPAGSANLQVTAGRSQFDTLGTLWREAAWVAGNVGLNLDGRSSSGFIDVEITGITSEIVQANPIIAYVLKVPPYDTSENDAAVLINLVDFTITTAVGVGQNPNDSNNFGSLTRGETGSGGNPGTTVYDATRIVPSLEIPYEINTDAFRAMAVPSGTTLPTTVPAAGQVFTLLADSGANTAGVYFSNGTAWVRS